MTVMERQFEHIIGPHKRPLRRHRRRGAALYVAVMFKALIVSLLGLSGLTLVRVERERATMVMDRFVARSNARSAVELALLVISNDSDWRNTYTNGQETTPQLIGPSDQGTVSWVLEDSDGNLTDADTELRLHGVGRLGTATQVLSIEIEVPIFNTLQCSVYSVGNIVQSSNSTSNSGPFASGATFTLNGNVYGDVEGDPVVNLGWAGGTVTDPGPDRTMPPDSVWDTYTALATPISYTSFTYIDSNTREMRRALLGATVNPFGSTNSEGIYYIQIPDGKTLSVAQCRIHGTLLIDLGANATFQVFSACLWDPYDGTNNPAMIAKGTGTANISFASSNSALKEGNPTPKVNFNPAGEPYDGITNAVMNDQWAPSFRGLFHVIGSGVHSTLSSNQKITGVFISEGTMTLGANLDVTAVPTIFSNPPPEYMGGGLEVVPGTWRSEDAPTP